MRLSLTTLVLLLLLVAPAGAQTTTASPVDAAVEALRGDPVYVHPDATTLSEAEADQVRRRIRSTSASSVFIAVLPEAALRETRGDPDAVLVAVREGLGRPGTYIVVPGRTLRADSSVLEVRDIANAAVARGGGLAEILDRMVTDIAQAQLVGPDPDQQPGGTGTGAPGRGEPAPGPGGGSSLLLLGILVAGGGALMLAGRARRRREARAELDEVKEQVRDELVELGDGIRALDIDVEMPGADPAARADYGIAVAAYDRANQAWNTARTVDDLEPVGAALEEGRWALVSARARFEGRTPPERRPPCFFDPRHGPSSREVEWAPPGGTPRSVPACEADAQVVDRGLDPGFRELEVHGQRVPYWYAGPAYSPFYGRGVFGGFGGLGLAGGLLGGLMLGEMLDGPDIAHADPGFGGDLGGGGFGGGDFGGGDFGGGGFGGGGDFGGGDF